MVVTPHGVGEDVSPVARGQVFVRSQTMPASLEVTFDAAYDNLDGLGEPGKGMYFYNISAAAGQDCWIQVAPDPHHYCQEIYIPHSWNWYFMPFDGVLIHMIHIRGSATMVDQPFLLVVTPGTYYLPDPRTRVHLPEISEIDPKDRKEVVLPNQITI